MKKIFILLFVSALILAFPTNGKAQNFENGDMVGNFGVGFGWYSYGYGATSLPAFSLSLEKGIKELDFGNLSIGGIVGWKHASYSGNAFGSSYDYSWNDFVVAARSAIHMDLLKNDQIDTYGGLGLGLRFQSANVGGFKASATDFLFAFYVGGRYYFTDNFAAFTELGYGLGYFTLGVSYKF